VLNKYFPPDFDPSKIPRCKEPRNKTFVIRLMAPCNMRCTTCGEYIYKGRKFNAKKEDVDDMNFLGLRIYRFYIKCTACLSEICFRTDPENTDYVLEAGATRNFEALSKAEKQAEREEQARQEELATNPMKLLEERTEASKHEMSRMEALEELQELNKRTMEVDYDGMLNKYDRQRESEAERQEREDEEFVKSIFGQHAEDGQEGQQRVASVKRILDEEGDEEEEEEKRRRRIKKLKGEAGKPTDILGQQKDLDKKESWQKSIGTLGVKKKGLFGVLVRKKGESVKKAESDDKSVSVKSESDVKPSTSAQPMSVKTEIPSTSTTTSATASTSTSSSAGPSSSLGLLGAYSGSESESD